VLWQSLVELYEVSFQQSETSGWKIGGGLEIHPHTTQSFRGRSPEHHHSLSS
jgi:hypothetical protein